MDIKALKSRVIGELLPEAIQTGLLWTPRKADGVKQLMKVTVVGSEVKEVEVGDIVILPDKWAGADLSIYDDETDTTTTLFVIDEQYLLARIRE